MPIPTGALSAPRQANSAERLLKEQRLRAAEASGGISNDIIYACIERIIRDRRLGGSVIDFGAGVGNLTQRLFGLGCFDRVVGVDILPRPDHLPKTVEWLQLDLNEPLPASATNVDLVVAAEVIEHLENPREVSRTFYRMLKPSGTLILTTPNNESWRSLISLLLRGHYALFSDICYPAHITALVRKDFERILAEAGFSHVQFDFTNNGGIPGHPALSWQRVSLGLLRGLRFSDNLVALAGK